MYQNTLLERLSVLNKLPFLFGTLFALFGVFLATCSSDKELNTVIPEAVSLPKPEPAPKKQPEPEPKVPQLSPQPVPLAYFGEPKLKWQNEPAVITTKKNGSVVLIVVDALNAKHLGIYGYDRDTSPRLDALSKRGVLFTNYVSNSSWTRPSFTTIITGQPKRVHHIEWDGNHLDKGITTLAERFRHAGYRTGGVVGNQLVQKIWGFDQGFSTYEDVKSLDQIFPRDELLVNKAISWLKKGGDKPFFLMLFLIDPHTPYRPLRNHRHFLETLPQGEVTRFPFREYRTPLSKPMHDRMVAAYDGEIHSVDKQIGRLVDYLDKNDKLDTTTIAIVADHGEAFNDHGCYTHTYHMWDSVLRVPFILVSPAIEAKGIYDDRPFTHMDIAPTLLDLVNIDHGSDPLPGISMVSALRDPSMNRQRTVFSQYNAHGVRRQSIRRGEWKLVHHHKVKDIALKKLTELQVRKRKPDPLNLPTLAWDKERYELYNLEKDPKETNELSKPQGDLEAFSLLKEALRPHLEGSSTQGQISKEMLKALENIGYIKRQ